MRPSAKLSFLIFRFRVNTSYKCVYLFLAVSYQFRSVLAWEKLLLCHACLFAWSSMVMSCTRKNRSWIKGDLPGFQSGDASCLTVACISCIFRCIFFFFFLIVVQLQLSHLFPHCSPLPPAAIAPTQSNPTHPTLRAHEPSALVP